ncbi:MAG: acetoacetate--CoA ligase [Candidatus Dormiibacterota bacterium]
MDRPSGGEEGALLWTPRPELVASSRLTDYAAWLTRARGIQTGDYPELWEWSSKEIASFWDSIWCYFDVVGDRGGGAALAGSSMPGAEWYPGATLNYAENALRFNSGSEDALVALSELRPQLRLSRAEVRRQVGSVAAHLREMGVGKGDRVAAYVPNIPEAVVACLATVSLGAIWSSCSPDFGERAVLDRFAQIEPKVLLAADGYRYGGRDFDRREVVAKVRARLPSVVRLVSVPYLNSEGFHAQPGSVNWGELVGDQVEPEFVRVPFDHPLWILYSSGTTGPPKPIVHSHGGIILEHLKVLGLHSDLGPGARSFWFTTTGWMMWNYLVSGLLVGAAVVLYDGSPAAPDLNRLWELAVDAKVTHFGTSAGHLSACMKAEVQPAQRFDLESLRFVGSTGSPLSPAGFEWVYHSVKQDLWLASLSGGTDLCTAFVLGCPWLPVRAGVIQCRGLGASVQAFDEAGTRIVDEVGELVITKPMPSMPVFLWGDRDGSRYRESYFSTFPGVWRHGDWIKVRSDGGVVIYGRSDSTINRNGVRMGTAEIYRLVEETAEFSDSLVVDVVQPDGGSRLALFVVLAPGLVLTDQLAAELKQRIRTQLSPRHVPDLIQEVGRIPRTRSGKKLEVPLKRILEGMAHDQVLDPEAVDDPDSLTPFLELAARWSGGDETGKP